MAKTILIFLTILFYSAAFAQKMNVEQYANFERYREANSKLGLPAKSESRVVFMGNSITEGWIAKSPEFFEKEGYIDRGIGGQVSHQMLLRFRADVIDLKPKVVVILAGTNDLAQNSGYTPIESIADNIFSMAELADYHGIKVILCSVLPASDFPWKSGLEPAEKIVTLNEIIRKYAAEKGFDYVDYHTAMKDDAGGLKVPEYTTKDDLVHPNKAGYAVMEKLVSPAIEKALGH
ncbi:MAG: SGNH/GDSL hydrolase family protein [Calditrichaeota bacterium]|nr:SGNH/GDSL hydrolase family protein [Calditrichota bacterium]